MLLKDVQGVFDPLGWLVRWRVEPAVDRCAPDREGTSRSTCLVDDDVLLFTGLKVVVIPVMSAAATAEPAAIQRLMSSGSTVSAAIAARTVAAAPRSPEIKLRCRARRRVASMF